MKEGQTHEPEPVGGMKCSNHKKDLYGETDMKLVAEAIGDLNYESLYALINYLSDKLTSDAVKDRKAGRKMLSQSLFNAASLIGYASEEISNAWDISKPFMEQLKTNEL